MRLSIFCLTRELNGRVEQNQLRLTLLALFIFGRPQAGIPSVDTLVSTSSFGTAIFRACNRFHFV